MSQALIEAVEALKCDYDFGHGTTALSVQHERNLTINQVIDLIRNHDTWQSIETAPVNKRVMVYGSSGERLGIQDEMGNWRSSFNGPIKQKPTHWRPLSAPPK